MTQPGNQSILLYDGIIARQRWIHTGETTEEYIYNARDMRV